MLTQFDLRGHEGPFDDVLPGPDGSGRDVGEPVASIIGQVRSGGDAALRDLTEKFDGVRLDDLRVPSSELVAASSRLPDHLASALELAWDRLSRYHSQEFDAPLDYVDGGVRVRHLVRPVARAGAYAPGGRARYPSTVLMCAAPARVAGVPDLALCVPPGPDGRIDDSVLAAAQLAGIDEVYRVGGAQAIAAMAFGTESIRAVDVIVGPGNRYVAEAKRQVSGVVGVASSFAGPSEVVVVAGPDTPPAWAAIDLVVQAEHGPDGTAWLVTWSERVLKSVVTEVERIVAASPRRRDLEATFASGGYACLVDGPEAAVDVSNVVAPEHLELLFDGAEELLWRVTSAGAVFCGPWSPASFGDYIAGPNHVLPTNRTARFSSALRADDFVRHIHAVTASRPAIQSLGPAVIALAEAEGLPAHADSIRYRL
jgi:histidinol dehydrogenase